NPRRRHHHLPRPTNRQTLRHPRRRQIRQMVDRHPRRRTLPGGPRFLRHLRPRLLEVLHRTRSRQPLHVCRGRQSQRVHAHVPGRIHRPPSLRLRRPRRHSRWRHHRFPPPPFRRRSSPRRPAHEGHTAHRQA